ncbi:MAG: CvpA family protein [Phycisphaerales bacterium]|nr:CvpA family protein [Phycisphaerales bacterium]
MFMNILVIVFVLGIAYTWSVRGVFNAMLHALCVLFAGAIAFAVWEPLALMLLGLSDAPIVEGMAWGVALILPFLIAMLALRVLTDKVITANIQNVKAIDYGGGAVFGLVTSIVTAGVLVIGLGYMRLPSTFLGYQPVWYAEGREGAGSLVENQKLWIPVDTITASLYQNLSNGSMASAEPLAKWYPDLTLTGFAARINPGEGAARNAITEDAFDVQSSYVIGNTNGSTERDDTIGDQAYMTIDGKSANSIAGYIAGYVVEFGAKAKEKGDKGGQVVVSNGQVRLLTQNNQDGSTNTVFPLAVISESSEQGKYGRWMFDGDDVFITSTGGKSRVPMGFEFYVPADETPLALYVKNIRVPVDSIGEPKEYATSGERDRLVRTGRVLTGEQVARKFDLSNAVTIDPSNRTAQSGARFGDSLGTVISSQIAKQRGLSLDDDNLVTQGEAKFDLSEEVGRSNAPQGKKLRVDKFWYGQGLSMVHVKVGSEAEGGMLSEAAKTADGDDPFMLIDSNDNEYEAVGYVYEDPASQIFEIRYTPGSTLEGINESGFPRISQSKEGQKLSLIFLVTSDVEIKYFTIGDTVLMRFNPVLAD